MVTPTRKPPDPPGSEGFYVRRGKSSLPAPEELVAEPHHGVVLAVDHPLLHRDECVVGDLDVFRTDLGAALGDVAEAEAVLLLRLVAPVERVERVHLELGDPHQVPRAGERLLVFLVVADHVTGVLAQEALDALAELLAAGHVLLLHPVLAGLQVLRWGERRDLARLLVVERHVGDEVADHRERPQRRDGDDFVLAERRHPRHAHQLRPAVDLSRARSALARLAVPAHGEIRGLRLLQAMNDVEHHLALVHLDGVVVQAAAGVVAAPDPHRRVVSHYALRPGWSASSSSVKYFSSSSISKSSNRSSRIGTCCSGVTVMLGTTASPPSARHTNSVLRHLASIDGWSSRVWPPRLSVRSSAALATHSLTSSMLRRSTARCQPGLNCRCPSTMTFLAR